ncbi:mechanosensitive ion channel family protein [Thalassiella azotivora]
MSLLAPLHTLVATTTPDVPEPEPSPTQTESTFERAQTDIPCGTLDPTFCGTLHDWTGNEKLARWVVGIGDTVLRVVLILVIALLVRWLVHRAIGRLSERIATGRTGIGSRGHKTTAFLAASPLAGERRAQRARTIGSVLKSVATGVVAGIAVLLVLGEFGINLGPLIAGAGVLGVALGFGAQSLVRDFLSGLFMIVEDQYGVGDVVDLGEAAGSVEAVGLRVTRLRAVDGTVWYVRNGEILRVGNQSQGWARAVLDVGVAYGEDVNRVQDLLADVAHRLKDDPDWGPLVLEEPEVWGVEQLSADAVVVRLVVKTVPLEQWKVARELRRRIKARFDAEGVEIPFPQRTVWLRQEAEERASGEAAPGRGHGDADRAGASPAGGPGSTGGPAPEEERRQPPPKGESDVANDLDEDSDKGL